MDDGSIDPPAPTRAEPPAAGMEAAGTLRTWAPLAAAAVLGLAAILVLRGTASGAGPTPSAATLLSVGLPTTLFTAAGLSLSLRSGLRLPWKIVVAAVAYNALVVLVKFVLAPAGLYEVNQVRTLDFELGSTAGALVTAGAVFLLYSAVYYTLYRIFGRRLRDRLALATRRRRLSRPGAVILAAVGVLILISGGATVAVLIPLLVLLPGLQYLTFVFSSAISLLVAAALVSASALAAVMFHGAEERGVVLRDAAALTTLFWIGLALLAVYHALWVVYVLVLATAWPLRVVVPK